MDQQFSLSWNNFHGNLSKGFAGLLGKGEFVDVTLAVDGHLLQAHKVILSICSPYFKKMFQVNPCQHPIVVLRDVTHKAMRDLLQFMYHGEVSVKREDLTSFIGTAELLQIKGLTNKENDEEREELEETRSNSVVQNQSADEICPTENSEQNNDEQTQNTELDLSKQRELIEKFQRLSNLKRKSEELLQKNYYSTDIYNVDKRPKLKDKYNRLSNHNVQSNYEHFRNLFEQSPVDASNYTQKNDAQSNLGSKEDNERHVEEARASPESCIDVKPECEDGEIIITDPAACTPKGYEVQKDLDYQSSQENCSGLNSLFMDLKNLVNGKVPHDLSRSSAYEEYPRNVLEHRLVTIPQKEDGKKKYPQRSCRLCWKLGKRRDTRFMCMTCELPFCKTPCFEIHFNNAIKASQIQGDYYAN